MIVKKGLAVAVILLFIGVAFAPSINANISKEMVEFTTEVCGLNGGKHTVKLTREEAEEVDALFKSIRERLNATETREEAEEIFKEAVVELDKYGLLGDVSVEEAQRLVTGKFQDSRLRKLLERFLDRNPQQFQGLENWWCLIQGRTNSTVIVSKPFELLWFLMLVRGISEILFFNLMDNLLSYIFISENFVLAALTLLVIFLSLPLLLVLVAIGEFTYHILDPVYYYLIYSVQPAFLVSNIIYGYAHGRIFTNGLNGKLEIEGDIHGHIYSRIWRNYWGVTGFTGLKIWDAGYTYYLGFAHHVKVDNEPPEV